MKKISTIISILIAILLYSAAAQASAYVVAQGDSLYEIAGRYGVSVKDIMRASNIKSNRLKLGQKLTIPDKGKPQAKAAVKPAALSNAVVATKPLVFKSVASKASHQPLHELSQAPNASVDGAAEVEEEPDAAVEDLVVENIYYSIKKGDTLATIARKNGTSVAEIKRLNHAKAIKMAPRKSIVIGTRTVPRQESLLVQAQNLNKELQIIAESPEIRRLGLTDRVMLLANKMLNIPYRFGGTTFMGIDCSAFVRTVFSFLNLALPRTAREQFNVGEKIGKDDLQAGDLVFFKTYAKFPSHVGIYIGDNMFIHASSVAKKITIDNITRHYYTKRYIGARRILEDEDGNEILEQPVEAISTEAEPKF